MLDLTVFKGPHWQRCGRLDIRFFSKSSISIPLCDTSCHPKQVHQSWPKERLKHFGVVCSKRAYAREAETQFKDWLLDRCPEHVGCKERSNPSHHQRIKPRTRIVLPFSQCWKRAGLDGMLCEIFKRFSQALDNGGVEANQYSVGIAWGLSGPHL